MDTDDRSAAQARWLNLTRVLLPAVAVARGWPVQTDHCFQRIFLDAACEDVWYDHISIRPAYAHASPALLDRAIALAEAALCDGTDLSDHNRRSLAWRRARRT
ncbi:MAG TPA: GCN5-related N-acetyltransferase [Sphingomonas sp.]|nr:GCN5-related N-acetyltransferase [Sphingomonas sp.]